MLELLKAAVEEKAGCKMRTPKDFEVLHQLLFDELHTLVSVSTLKRIWGYVQSYSQPRPSTLTPLAQFVGYADWDAFEQAHSEAGHVETPSRPHRKRSVWWIAAAALLAVIGLLATIHFIRQPKESLIAVNTVLRPSGQRILHKGQDGFPSLDDYLVLFGITAKDTAYYQPVPGLSEVYAWGPEYGNPTWHNEGNRQEQMPTITEYWTPSADEYSEEYIRLANEKLYYERLERDELRITFMRNIEDSLYLFLGVYRMDREASTTERFVWRRVADSLDLGYLDELPKLRK